MTRPVVIESMNIQSMADALRARDDGMIRASEHAETDAPGWGERAYQAVIANPYLRHFDQFTIDMARQWVYAAGLDEPEDGRCWGSVTTKLLRDGRIEAVGYLKSPSSNLSPKRSYRLVRAG